MIEPAQCLVIISTITTSIDDWRSQFLQHSLTIDTHSVCIWCTYVRSFILYADVPVLGYRLWSQ